MALTSDEIKQIEDAADALNGWRDYVTKTHSDALGCYISLRHAFETQVDKSVDILLDKKPVLGQNIKKECDKLLKEAKLVEELYEQNAADARVEEAEILGSARQLISRLQQIAQNVKKELAAEKPAETGQEAVPGFMSAADLAEHYGVDAETLRKRLDRHRAKHSLDADFFIESQNRGKNKPKYLYNAKNALPVIEKLKGKQVSVKRPSEKT